jgi:DDE family transposase
MKAELETEDGKARYKKRKQTVEPVFGIIKSAIGFTRFHLRRVAIEGLANGLPEGFASALCRLAQRRLELGESLLDWVEVGAVGRQIDELCALRLDRRADPDHVVAAQIVEQEDVVRPQGRRQHLLDVGAKALAIDGAIKDARRGDPAAAQTGHQGDYLPMTVRYRGQQPPPTGGAAMAARHVGGRPGLVDED